MQQMYVDDVGAFHFSREHDIELLTTILRHLQDNSFTINPLKCEWGVKERIDLGIGSHCMAASNPRKRKMIQSSTWTILERPLTFASCVNYYHDMWPSCAHVLKPLTDSLGMKKNQNLNCKVYFIK
jgi:hypothetical protein